MLFSRPPTVGLPPTLPPRPSPRQVRGYCRALVRALHLDPPLDVARICAEVGRLNERRIELVAEDLPAAVFGISTRTQAESVDYILVQRHTTPAHRAHIVLHELGHILAGHFDDGHGPHHALGGAEEPGSLVRDREWVAETIATVLQERAMVHLTLIGAPAPDPATRLLDEALRSSRVWL